MKETTRTSRTAGYLEKIFRALNNDSFGGELEEPIISIMSTPGAYGHITVGKVWKRKDEDRHELNIAADWLQRPIENVVATMIHEMVHLYNIQHGIQDTSRGESYHNKRFKEEAEKHMIRIDKSEKYGWTITNPTENCLSTSLTRAGETSTWAEGACGDCWVHPGEIKALGRLGSLTGTPKRGNRKATAAVMFVPAAA